MRSIFRWTKSNGVVVKRLFLFLFFFISGAVYPAHAQEITIVAENYPPFHYEHNSLVVDQGTETVQGST